jgi:hypothetical protein
MQTEFDKINKKLSDILSQESGYFGRIDTWGQRPTKYEYVGYELDIDFMSTLQSLSEEERKSFVRIINYFEIHANPLKKMLNDNSKQALYDFYSECAWSHFMTVIMFGMLEVAVKSSPSCIVWQNQKKGQIKKLDSINSFLETFLSQDIRDDIAKRYKTEDNKKLNSFSKVIEHLWQEIRSGFVHEASLDYKGTEWTTLSGIGSKEDPIKIGTDVPMQELLQITWQAILNSCGYKGLVKLSKYKK